MYQKGQSIASQCAQAPTRMKVVGFCVMHLVEHPTKETVITNRQKYPV